MQLKLFSVSLAVGLMFSGFTQGGSYTLTYDVDYRPEIAVDGRFDGWQDAFAAELIFSETGHSAQNTDLAASASICWNDSGLLFYFNITDPDIITSDCDDQLWAHDSVELFLSHDVDSGDYFQLVMAPGNDQSPRFKFYDFRSNRAVQLKQHSRASYTDDGYIIETMIPWSSFPIQPKTAAELGVQIFVNNVDSSGSVFQVQWYPHAVNHSSDLMHRIRLTEKTIQSSVVDCFVESATDIAILDLRTPAGRGIEHVKIFNRSQLLAQVQMMPDNTGFKKAVAAIDTTALKDNRTELQFVNNGKTVGKTVILKDVALDRHTLQRLQALTLVPASKWGYIFEKASFPALRWSDPEVMAKFASGQAPAVRWFDAHLNEVTSPTAVGRYLAYAQADLGDGRTIRRSATFYCIDNDSHPWRHDPRIVIYSRTRPWWHPWQGQPKAHVDYIAQLGIKEHYWSKYQPTLSAWAGKTFFEFLESDPYGPVLLSFLHEAQKYDSLLPATATPEIVDNDIHLALKRKLLDVPDNRITLAKPKTLPEEKKAVELILGSATQAGFAADSHRKIKELCQEWFDQSGEPFVMLLARDGVVFFHEVFADQNRPIELDTPMFMASITKCMTGLLFAQFVDQGLLEIDQPVGDFLIDYPSDGEKAITFRHCFTHTAGMQGHYEFGGMHNGWLENVMSLQLDRLTPGRIHEYNGMSYDLAAKAMEMLAGKSAFRLMHEYLFAPLGVTDTVIDDMATCSSSTAWDTAKLGQLLLNKGSYGDKMFFGPETFEKLLPKDLSKFYPEINRSWGIALTWMLQQHREPEQSGRKYLLSDRVIGHGAASSAIFRVDLENDLIMVQTRNTAGRDYDKYYYKLMELVDRLMQRD